MKNILFIGAGNMAEGMIKGLIKTQVYEPKNIFIKDISKKRCEYIKNAYGVSVFDESIYYGFDSVVIAVRPQDFESVGREMITESTIIISICAGINLDTMISVFGSDRKLVRVMPNVLIEVMHGYSAASVNDKVDDEDKKVVQNILDALGQTMFIDESVFNEFTAFSCAGPAYVVYFANALIDAGVQSGFSRSVAKEMVLENLIGTAKTLNELEGHPYEITDAMTSPAGVTIEGLHALNEHGFSGIVQTAVKRAVDKSNSF